MAFAIIHIIIAERVLKYIPEICDYSTYILGTIAPDAVHANRNYSITLKERSHLFTRNLIWGEINNWEKAEEWIQNIRNYYGINQGRYQRDFLLGYIVHLLADVYNSMFFYTPFIQSIKADYEETMKQYREEAFGMSCYLFSKYPKYKHLQKTLKAGMAITMEGVIEKEDIEKRIEDLFEEELQLRDICVCEYSICTVKEMEDLIHGAVGFVRDRLLDMIESCAR